MVMINVECPILNVKSMYREFFNAHENSKFDISFVSKINDDRIKG